MNSGACDHPDPCTTNGQCLAGQCVGEPLVCDDGNPCTDDVCDPALGCKAEPNTLACDDSNPCTGGDFCDQGTCSGIPIEACCLTSDDCIQPSQLCTAAHACVDVHCTACDTDADCGSELNACAALPSGNYCVISCDAAPDSCPEQTACSANDAEGPAFCYPTQGDCQCAPMFSKVCAGGNLMWTDSCGVVSNQMAIQCDFGCAVDQCCPEGTSEQEGECLPEVVEPNPENDEDIITTDQIEQDTTDEDLSDDTLPLDQVAPDNQGQDVSKDLGSDHIQTDTSSDSMAGDVQTEEDTGATGGGGGGGGCASTTQGSSTTLLLLAFALMFALRKFRIR